MKDQVPMSTTEELIRAANPVPTSEVPPGDSPHARRLLAALPTAAPPRRRAVRPRGRPLGLALGGAAVAGLTAAIVAAVTITGPASPARPVPLTGSLRDLVLAADHHPAAPTLQPGQFQYTESVSQSQVTSVPGRSSSYFNVDYAEHRQSWIGADGSGRIVETNVDPTFPTPRDRARWAADGRPSLAEPAADQAYGPRGLSDGPGVNLDKLPTNVAQLTQLITGRKVEGGPAGTVEDFVQVGDLLRATSAPPALRAALFQVAAHLPGVRVLPHATDHDGRLGIALAMYVRDTEGAAKGKLNLHELIFDRATSALIGEESAFVNPRTLAPVDPLWTVYVKSFVVGSTSSTTPVSPASGS
jgi:hypothetical protein